MIEFVGAHARRGEQPVLNGVTLTVAAGETVALVGRSGSGKTTMLRLVNRLLPLSAGAVRVAGRDVTQWDPIALRRQTGYVVQEVGLFPHLSIGDNIAVVPRLLGWSDDRVAASVAQMLTLVDLPPALAVRQPHELSGGQRQRVGLARALAADPPVLLMDEPFGALDPLTRTELHAALRKLLAAAPRSVLLVTHDLAEAFALAGRVAVLDGGTLVAVGSAEQLTHSTHPFVRALVDTRFT